MGITIGEGATIEFGGDMVGGDKIVVPQGAWSASAARIVSEEGLPQQLKEQATQALASLHLEMAKDEPDTKKMNRLVEILKRLVPGAIEILVAAAPEIVKIIPGLLA